MEFLFVFVTKAVCFTAFRKIRGIPSSTFNKVRKLILNKQKVISKQRTKRRQSKSMTALAWLSTYAESNGKKLPNTAQIHLPPRSTKQHVIETMLEETQNTLSLVLTFCACGGKKPHILQYPRTKDFPNAIFALKKNRLGETRDRREREALKMKRDRHLKKQKEVY